MKLKNYKKITAAVLVIASLLFGQGAWAATVFLSPSSSSYFQNKTFSVTVYVSSDKQSLNAVSGNLTFPNDKLEVVSVSKSGSIFNFWVQEPSFSNANGKISFEGVVLNPGFQGNSGRLVSVNFKTKSSGSAKVAFSAASVLANDGKGTNILSGTSGATFSIKAVSLLISDNAQSQPAVEYDPPISSKEIKDLDDGIWYLHAAFKYDNGVSAISRVPVKVDTVSPENIAIAPIAASEDNKESVQFLLSAEDKLSGISYYELSFDNQSAFRWDITQGNIVAAPSLSSGQHELKVKAFDLAGNYSEAVHIFEIKSAGVPIIDKYPFTLSTDDSFAFAGYALWKTQVQINLRRVGGDELVYIVATDKIGSFNFKLERLAAGQYSFYAQSLSAAGVSPVTEIYYFEVKAVPNHPLAYLLALIFSILLNCAFAIWIYRQCRQKGKFKRGIKTVYQSAQTRAARRRIVKK